MDSATAIEIGNILRGKGIFEGKPKIADVPGIGQVVFYKVRDHHQLAVHAAYHDKNCFGENESGVRVLSFTESGEDMRVSQLNNYRHIRGWTRISGETYLYESEEVKIALNQFYPPPASTEYISKTYEEINTAYSTFCVLARKLIPYTAPRQEQKPPETEKRTGSAVQKAISNPSANSPAVANISELPFVKRLFERPQDRIFSGTYNDVPCRVVMDIGEINTLIWLKTDDKLLQLKVSKAYTLVEMKLYELEKADKTYRSNTDGLGLITHWAYKKDGIEHRFINKGEKAYERIPRHNHAETRDMISALKTLNIAPSAEKIFLEQTVSRNAARRGY